MWFAAFILAGCGASIEEEPCSSIGDPVNGEFEGEVLVISAETDGGNIWQYFADIVVGGASTWTLE